jgi:DNA adenine methylase
MTTSRKQEDCLSRTSNGGNFATPLRYPGGKGRLGHWLAQLLTKNNVEGGWYIEPYAGGAGAALFLLTKGYVEGIVINDLDPNVHAFWWAILNDTTEFLRLLDGTPVTIDTWEQQREIHKFPEQYSKTRLGFATFFLNRTNRSGILDGGVIGGRKQDGFYRLCARYKKDNLRRRIELIAKLKERIVLFRMDAVELLKGRGDAIPARSLTYLDPPYYHKGSQLYRNHYKPEDHLEIARVVVALRTPWLVSYDNCPEIRQIYAGCASQEFSLHYSTHLARPKATEVVFYGNLELPGPPVLKR